jgi:pyrimidine operon attenuation protein / uracil phosphoribosyltransferase
MAKLIMDSTEMNASLKKIAKEIIDTNKDLSNIALVGILKRGEPLAKRIAEIITLASKTKIEVGALDISLHRDDIMKKGSEIEMMQTDIPFSMDGKVVILVDDVISAGRTIRAALDGLTDYGRPAKIKLVALIDRDHRELPIHPDYTGKKITTLAEEEVTVHLKETDGEDKVTVQ